MDTQNAQEIEEQSAATRYEILVRHDAAEQMSQPLVVAQDELLPWVLRVVGVEAMRDFVLSQLPHAQLTTQQAADQLGMSRPSLIKLLQDGAIPYTLVGNRRYLEQRDLDDYRRTTHLQGDRFAHNPDHLIDEHLRALQQQADDEGDFS